MTASRTAPRPSCSARFSRLLAAVATLDCALGAPACGATYSEAQPEAALATSREAQHAFREIDKQWRASALPARAKLEPRIRDFLRRHGSDPLARQARLYLAWLALERGHLEEAESLARRVRKGPPGAIRDHATVIVAAVLRRRGRSAESLALLEPLHGRIIDPAERLLETGELVRAELDLKRYDAAIAIMVDWLEEAPDVERRMVQSEIGALLAELPAEVLEDGVAAMKEVASSPLPDERAESVAWLRVALRERLVRAALTARNVQLAKRLLRDTPATLERDEQGDALARLAAEARVAPRIFGRAFGFVLRVGESQARARAAEVVRGMSRALGTVEGISREDGVRMLLREARGIEGVEGALGALAGDGAALLVAGVTAGGAALAEQFAAQSKIPVVLLVAPERPVSSGGHAFVLGSSESAVRSRLEAALRDRGVQRIAVVGGSEVPCSFDASAGMARFPAASWRDDRVEALVLLGNPRCSEDALSSARAVGLSPTLAFGLETAHAWSHFAEPGSLSITAGPFPRRGRDSPAASPTPSDELSGSGPSWFEALGHDAAVLAAAALATLPLQRTDEARQVTTLHLRARDAIARAEAALWTADAQGFSGGRTLPRKLVVTELSKEVP